MSVGHRVKEFLAAVADPDHEAFAAERVFFDDPRMRWRLAFPRR